MPPLLRSAKSAVPSHDTRTPSPLQGLGTPRPIGLPRTECTGAVQKLQGWEKIVWAGVDLVDGPAVGGAKVGKQVPVRAEGKGCQIKRPLAALAEEKLVALLLFLRLLVRDVQFLLLLLPILPPTYLTEEERQGAMKRMPPVVLNIGTVA
ncbi:hypothetical protein M427DRAFT_36108 [Gonapodya prolifera JEL478]|uniref:Uncharacterized protein n=1 Tax=Gonapodya prolifera (strain JEL478) TaxID=1344416 RepID=A0A139A3F6_GONPJ|nr:hypothetical protein M427DRAFT_36108 [Gonapodya prolifera JEL478]|eukprot:KXS11199.1 hypothetical protein M427DRAFT_36108 [Gonapodya prolifera JEL478]